LFNVPLVTVSKPGPLTSGTVCISEFDAASFPRLYADQIKCKPVVRQAEAVLAKHFINARGKPIMTPFFGQQMGVLYEADFFHWTVSDGLELLVEKGSLTRIDLADVSEFRQLEHVPQMSFYANAEAAKADPDWMRRKALGIAKVVNGYSSPWVTATVGRHAEEIVRSELRAAQFRIVAEHANEYLGRKWTESNADLDYIAEHKSGRLTIGVEVKNSLSLMKREEMEEKIAICQHLGITPVFAVRWIKPYMQLIQRNGGFGWEFESQMYPLGFESRVHEMRTRLSVLERCDSRGHPLQFPVSVLPRMPELSVKNFDRWVEYKISSNLQADMT
jgi:hypothetical protein